MVDDHLNIAICIIAYNRVDTLKRLLKSVNDAYYPSDAEVTLIISIDKSDTDEVCDFADKVSWSHGEKRVVKHQTNLGLHKHIMGCGDYLKEFDALIVLEDDLLVSQDYFNYALQCVRKYASDPSVAGISLYNFNRNYQTQKPFLPVHSDSDVYLMKCAMSWGQVWMKEQWSQYKKWYDAQNGIFEFSPTLPSVLMQWPKSSWLKFHTRYCIENNKYFVFPYVARTTCFSEAGTHVKRTNTFFQTPLFYEKQDKIRLTPSISYDGFFECEQIYQKLGLDSYNLCVDINGEKGNPNNLRYWLTSKNLPFKVIRSFALELKPIDLNVLLDVEGKELFLYDVTVSDDFPLSKKECSVNSILKEEYLYGKRSDMQYIILNGIRQSIPSSAKRLIKKILKRK